MADCVHAGHWGRRQGSHQEMREAGRASRQPASPPAPAPAPCVSTATASTSPQLPKSLPAPRRRAPHWARDCGQSTEAHRTALLASCAVGWPREKTPGPLLASSPPAKRSRNNGDTKLSAAPHPAHLYNRARPQLASPLQREQASDRRGWGQDSLPRALGGTDSSADNYL